VEKQCRESGWFSFLWFDSNGFIIVCVSVVPRGIRQEVCIDVKFEKKHLHWAFHSCLYLFQRSATRVGKAQTS